MVNGVEHRLSKVAALKPLVDTTPILSGLHNSNVQPLFSLQLQDGYSALNSSTSRQLSPRK